MILGTGAETEAKLYIEDLVKRFPEIKGIHGIRIRKMGDRMHLVLRCHFDQGINIQQAHEVSSKFEKAIRDAYPNIDRIDMHEEPA